MSFLFPLFLAGLAALAIPVLLHLIQKERKNVVEFPSLMFLRRIPYQSVQRRRIRHWLLLAMRLGALALIVLAFARPFFERRDLAAAAAAGAREVVVLVDRSYSMGYGDRWSRAVSAARGVVEGLQPGDRGTVVFFATGADVALRSTGDRSRLSATLAAAEPGAGATRFGPALKLAGSILSESGLPRREVVLVSDFQRAAWQGAEGVRLPDGAILTPVTVGDAEPANLAVTPVSLQRSRFQNQDRIAVTAGVRNHGGQPVSGVEIALELGDRPVQSRRLDLEAHGTGSVTFDPFTLSDPRVRGSVRLAADALERDNVFHFTVSPEAPVRLVIGERGSSREASLYLSRALAVGESPRFETVIRPADSLTADDLTAAVVILNDAPVPQATADRLARFVEGGGGLFVVLGERAAWPGSADILPGVPGVPVDRSKGTPARLGALEYGHPVFEIFRAPRSGDFSAARVYGYRAMTSGPDARVLARFDDGGPALLERTVGSGHVIVWTSTLDLYWNDLAVKPVFLPFVHRVVRYLAGYREPTPWRTVGDVVEPSAETAAARAQAAASRIVVTPGGQRVPLDDEGSDVLELTEQGFYEIRAQGREEDDVPLVVASNVDLTESDLTMVDPQEVAAAAMGRAGGTVVADALAAPSREAQEGAQRIWWYLLFAGLLLLGAETVIANRSAV